MKVLKIYEKTQAENDTMTLTDDQRELKTTGALDSTNNYSMLYTDSLKSNYQKIFSKSFKARTNLVSSPFEKEFGLNVNHLIVNRISKELGPEIYSSKVNNSFDPKSNLRK